jgi:hypothetical protein
MSEPAFAAIRAPPKTASVFVLFPHAFLSWRDPPLPGSITTASKHGRPRHATCAPRTRGRGSWLQVRAVMLERPSVTPVPGARSLPVQHARPPEIRRYKPSYGSPSPGAPVECGCCCRPPWVTIFLSIDNHKTAFMSRLWHDSGTRARGARPLESSRGQSQAIESRRFALVACQPAQALTSAHQSSARHSRGIDRQGSGSRFDLKLRCYRYQLDKTA